MPVRSLFDRRGNLLSRSAGKASPGEVVSIIIHYTPEAQGNHTLVGALVRFGKPGGSTRGYVIPSLEVVDDDSGRTTVLSHPNPER